MSVSTWPPPAPGTESQQPLVSPKPNGPEPVKSLSSQVIKMTELPVHAFDAMIWLTVVVTLFLFIYLTAALLRPEWF